MAAAANANDGGHRKAEDRSDYDTLGLPYRDVCGKCGAQRVDEQIGLEASVDEYIAKLVTVCEEVRRVLRADGSFWLNLGDSYCGSWGASGHRSELDGGASVQRVKNTAYLKRGGYETHRDTPPTVKQPGLKSKDLMGVPWRAAFALQAAGWWLRSEITWIKTTPMPESVSDRPTSATEKVFLFTKSPAYFYDAVAVAEPSVSDHDQGNSYKRTERLSYQDANGARGNEVGWTRTATRNRRNFLILGPEGFKGAHFAVMPTKLAEICIRAGTSAWGVCGAKTMKLRLRADLTPDEASRVNSYLKEHHLI